MFDYWRRLFAHENDPDTDDDITAAEASLPAETGTTIVLQ